MPELIKKLRPFETRHGWTPARRLAQAQRLRAARPWLRSTGPRTASGKARVAQNARKHGCRSVELQRLKRSLSDQGRFLKLINYDIKARKRAFRAGQSHYLPLLPVPILHAFGYQVTQDIIHALKAFESRHPLPGNLVETMEHICPERIGY
jgi:hypothetical protein